MPFKKNTAVTGFTVGLVSSADGSDITTGTPVGYYLLDGATQTAIGDTTPVHEGNGLWSFDLTAGEMNGDVVGLTFTHTSAITQHFTIKTETKLVSELVDLTAAQVNTECDTALTDYDPPTNAELEARTILAADYFDPATDAVANVTLVATTTTNTDMIAGFATETKQDIIDANVDAILVDTADLQTNQGNWLTATGFNTVVPPSVAQFDARTLLAADYFDPAVDVVASVTLVATTTTNTDMRGTDSANTTTPPTVDAIADQVWDEVQSGHTTAGTFGLYLDSEVSAAGGGSAPTVAEIADGVWDELISGHAIGGSTGEALSAAGAAGDPWITALPGSYTSGQAGKIIGDNINATISSRSTQTSVDTVDSNVDSILVDTAEIGTAGAGLTNIGTIATVTNLTNLPTIPVNWITSAGVSVSALDGKGDWNIGKTGYTLTTQDWNTVVPDAAGVAPTSEEIADQVWDEVLTGVTHNVATSAGRRLRQIQEFQGYAGGQIWVDTLNGTAGTTNYENGTVENPVLTWADALTINASLGFNAFYIKNGSSIALTADSTDYAIKGNNWSLDLGGQIITGVYFEGSNSITGTGTDGGVIPRFKTCLVGDVTLPPFEAIECCLNGVITASAPGDYFIVRCHSLIGGASTPAFDFGAVIGNVNLSMAGYARGIELRNYNAFGVDQFSISGQGQIIYAASCSGSVEQSGDWRETNTGGVTINRDLSAQNSVDILADTGTTLPAQITGLNNFNPVTDTVVNVTNVTAEVDADIKKINGVIITGDGSVSPFDV